MVRRQKGGFGVIFKVAKKLLNTGIKTSRRFKRGRVKKTKTRKIVTKRKMRTPWDNSVYGNLFTIVECMTRPRY